MKSFLYFLFAAGICMGFACGSGNTKGGEDAGADGDADGDADTDTDADTGADAGADSGADADTDTDTDADTDSAASTDLLPETVGSFWEYVETDTANVKTSFRYEAIGTETIVFGHGVGKRNVLVIENTFPASPKEKRTYYVENDGVRSVRHRQEIYDTNGLLTKVRDFVPALLRLDRGRDTVGEEWDEPLMTRYSDRKDGSPIVVETMTYHYKVTALREKVTVPAGSFDCFVLERSEVGGTETKIYYFAPGVGKVKEETVGDKVEELVNYEVH